MGSLKQLIYSIFSYFSSLFIQQSTSSRAACKLNAYYVSVMKEVDKAVSADADAIRHYRKAVKILSEACSMPLPCCKTSSEQEKLNSLREKISKKQGQVSTRLQVLLGKIGAESIKKEQTGAVKQTASSPKQVASKNSSGPSGHNSTIKSDILKITALKRAQDNGDDGKFVEMIESEILDRRPSDKWEDIAGLEMAKNTLKEMVILPMARKDLFFGLRTPSKGLLLFGPPGNGKTMLAKAVASESNATFFNITPSSLTSKWVGESEKLVRTLFMVAHSRKPSVIFIDEIDSILSARTSRENDSSTRLKSEFLVQFDGLASKSDDLVVIGATNRPHELDDAVLRRFVKRIYIPLPDENVRRILLKHRLKDPAFSLPSGDLQRLAKETEGYSGSDLDAVCKDAAMMPLRELASNGKISTVKPDQVRGLKYEDFESAVNRTKPSINISKLEELEQWNKKFGCNRD